jgi:two-component system, NtrC family, response regulator GlrR
MIDRADILKIAHIDDEASMRKLVALQLHPHQVTSFDDPRTAVEEINKGLDLEPPLFDLVVTDFHMSGINGTELSSLIRARHPSVPIVLLSAQINAAEGQTVFDAKVKKGKREDLLQGVQDALARRKVRRP